MSEINKELEIYRLVMNETMECGWVNDTQFYIWIDFDNLKKFIDNITKVFGDRMLVNGGVEMTLRRNYVCIDLTLMLENSDIDFEMTFPKEDFQH
jgi:hypothetical protein